jgi:hypothetical protein
MKDGQTIGQWLKWDFEANHELIIRDNNNNVRYLEHWDRVWAKYQYDSQGRLIYTEYSTGYWSKMEYDSQLIEIYFEDSDGVIRDNRTPEIIEHNGRKYKLIP